MKTFALTVIVICSALGGAMLFMVATALWGTTPRDVYTEVCADVFAAEYVSDLSACIDGDTIVHRFGVTP